MSFVRKLYPCIRQRLVKVCLSTVCYLSCKQFLKIVYTIFVEYVTYWEPFKFATIGCLFLKNALSFIFQVIVLIQLIY